jgi:hypothetical protein
MTPSNSLNLFFVLKGSKNSRKFRVPISSLGGFSPSCSMAYTRMCWIVRSVAFSSELSSASVCNGSGVAFSADKLNLLNLRLILRRIPDMFILVPRSNDPHNLRGQSAMHQPDAAIPRQVDAVVGQNEISRLLVLMLLAPCGVTVQE